MSKRAGKAQFKLRRRRLGLCFGPGGTAYVAEVDSGRPRVHVLEAGAFAAGVRSGRVRARRWRVAMPRRDCLLKRLPLPAGDVAEARRMLEFEVPGLVPMQQGGICYDVLPLQAEETSNTNYLVWLSPRDRIEKAAGPLREAGIVPDVVVPDCVALWWLLRSKVAKDEAALLICMDGWCGHVLAVGDGRLEGARETGPAGEDGLDLAVLLTEAQRACGPEEAELEVGSRRRMVLAGGCEQVEALAAQWRSIRQAADQADPGCEVLPAAVQMRWADGGEQTEPLSEVAAMIAAGCVLEEAGAAGEGFNLAPAEWQEGRRRRERWRAWVVSAGSAAARIAAAKWFVTEPLAFSELHLTDERMRSADVLLIGDPATDPRIRHLFGQLDIEMNDQGVRIGERCLTGSNLAILALGPNPLSDRHYLLVLAGTDRGSVGRAAQMLIEKRPPIDDSDCVVVGPAGHAGQPTVLWADRFDWTWHPIIDREVLARLERPHPAWQWARLAAVVAQEQTGADGFFVSRLLRISPDGLVGPITAHDLYCLIYNDWLLLARMSPSVLRELVAKAMRHCPQAVVGGLFKVDASRPGAGMCWNSKIADRANAPVSIATTPVCETPDVGARGTGGCVHLRARSCELLPLYAADALVSFLRENPQTDLDALLDQQPEPPSQGSIEALTALEEEGAL